MHRGFRKGFLKSAVKNERGQVAIFVALIFQVLFVFFAMVINVGLLVHHKINLQNSVDLAAYYGAMKQAETLNAMGHINYQIRQSWKLLTWRYRQIGVAGNFSSAHPFDKNSKNIIPGRVGEEIDPNPAYQKFYDYSPFCVTYVPFRPMPSGENTCKRAEEYDSIPLPQPPAVIANFIAFSAQIRAASQQILNQAVDRCKVFGTMNYVTLSRFVTAYVMDQAEKKLLMRHLALGLSDNDSEIQDLDGESVKLGIRNTLINNLTAANRDSMQYEFFNSLGTAECGNSSTTYDPPKWLSEIKIHPAFFYTDTRCNNQAIVSDARNLAIPPFHQTDASVPDNLKMAINYFKPFVSGTQPPPKNFSIGYEKNPWCMAYVGVKATTRPRIPFAPLSEVALTARAFAKPFGGKIGPWYGSRWPKGPAGGNAQSEGEKIDGLLPPRARDLSQLGSDLINSVQRVANYSKYPGDVLGMKSYLTMGQFGRAIYALDPQWRTRVYSPPTSNGTAIDPNDPGLNPNNADVPNFSHWYHLGVNFKDEGHGDILAYDGLYKGNNPMRRLETIAIAPDLFDITYYSIEPDYYNMYFKRIKDLYLPKKGGYLDLFMARSDLGSRAGDELESYSVKKQLQLLPGFLLYT